MVCAVCKAPAGRAAPFAPVLTPPPRHSGCRFLAECPAFRPQCGLAVWPLCLSEPQFTHLRVRSITAAPQEYRKRSGKRLWGGSARPCTTGVSIFHFDKDLNFSSKNKYPKSSPIQYYPVYFSLSVHPSNCPSIHPSIHSSTYYVPSTTKDGAGNESPSPPGAQLLLVVLGRKLERQSPLGDEVPAP